MDNPLVSIIVPVYNVEEYLPRCIKSILAQTYPNFELLLINDGSTDNSLHILEQFSRLDERITIYSKDNGGQASARNLGLEKMNGEYLIMVDSDDYIDHKLLEVCLEAMSNHNCDLVLFDRYDVNQNGDKRYYSIGSGTSIRDAGSIPWNKFYKAELWEGCYFPEGYWYEDLGVIPVIVSRARKIVNINIPLYYYETTRNGSQTNAIRASKFLDIIAMLDNANNKIKELGLLEEKKLEVQKLYIEHLIYVTILIRVVKVKDKSVRVELIDKINSFVKKELPDWRDIEYSQGNLLTSRIRKLILELYLNKNFLLGDLIWKYPKLIKRKLSGF